MSHQVVIVQQAVLQYRRGFYERLRTQLADVGVELTLVHSNPIETTYRDAIDFPWAHRVPPRWFQVGGGRLLWQPAYPFLRDADLVIVEQATKHLLNLVLAAEQKLGRRRFALWGHGRDFHARGDGGAAERVKRVLTRMPHWWFAYTELSAEIVAAEGFPRERITVVQNAVDSRAIARDVERLDADAADRIRADLALAEGRVGLFIGGLVASKRLEFLCEAADVVRAMTGDFTLLVAGAGEGEHAARMRAYAAERAWVHLLGPRFEADKAALLRIADVVVVPAWAGLVVVDAFAAGVPIVVSASQAHPPEISYLRDGVNGLVVDDAGSPQRYGEAVAALLQDRARLAALAEGGRQARERYTVEAMVDRFVGGICSALRG